MAATVGHIGSDAAEEIATNQGADPVLELLRLGERLVAETRRTVDGALCQLQLWLHARQTIRDPQATRWLEEARRSVKDGTAQRQASTREDILRAMEKAAGQH